MANPLLEERNYYTLKLRINALRYDVWPGEESVDKSLHLVKLSVGTESVEDLATWQASPARPRINGLNYHATRMWPKRADEILAAGGSIYWVIQGVCQARQKIAGFEELTGNDGIRRCAILLDPRLHRVEPTRKRPFQGWRYLQGADAPSDLNYGATRSDADVPPTLLAALAEIGVR
jgi:hypothetical protein